MQMQWLGRLERLPYKQVLHGFAFDIITSAMEFRFSSHLLHSQEVPSERLQGEGSNPTLTARSSLPESIIYNSLGSHVR
jgi:hypothetical protein